MQLTFTNQRIADEKRAICAPRLISNQKPEIFVFVDCTYDADTSMNRFLSKDILHPINNHDYNEKLCRSMYGCVERGKNRHDELVMHLFLSTPSSFASTHFDQHVFRWQITKSPLYMHYAVHVH